jgi:hypothetical protein
VSLFAGDEGVEPEGVASGRVELLERGGVMDGFSDVD